METSVWTNIEIVGSGGPALRAEQVEVEWPRMTYMQRLLAWLKSRIERLLPLSKKQEVPETVHSVSVTVAEPKEYLCDTHDLILSRHQSQRI